MQTGRIFGVGMPEFHRDQVISFQIYCFPLEFLRDHQLVRNLPWKAYLPDSFKGLRGGILPHDLNGLGRRHCFGVWESLQERADSKPMVSMAMRNVDGYQVFIFRRHPICQSVSLLDRHEGIHQDSVPRAIDQR